MGHAIDTFGRLLKGKAALLFVARHSSPGILPATPKSPRDLCVGRGGRYPRRPAKGRSGTSLCRPPSIARHLSGNSKVLALPLRGTWRSIPSADCQRTKRHFFMPPSIHRRASCRRLQSLRAASTWGAAVDTLRRLPKGELTLLYAARHSSPGILPGTPKSSRGLCVGRGGRYPRPPAKGRSGTP